MKYDVIIVGGGPAGSAAAIVLASSGARVALLEARRMPREKLCGEFITPECFPILSRLGVLGTVLASGANRITTLTLSVPQVPLITASIRDFSPGGESALGLSRKRFDAILFEEAARSGAECIEGVAVRNCTFGECGADGVEGVRLRESTPVKFQGSIIIDASGKNSRIAATADRRAPQSRGSRLYAVKTHLERVAGVEDQVELNIFPGGYGGLSRVEDGTTNVCLITTDDVLKKSGHDRSKILRDTIMKNPLARERLGSAKIAGEWLTVGPLSFGTRHLSRDRVIAVGDASGMIDPFTGTGIQIALRTGEAAAEAILSETGIVGDDSDGRRPEPTPSGMSRVRSRFASDYDNQFAKRLRAARLLRHVAFSPRAAMVLGGLLSVWPGLALKVLRATRAGG
jgi:menaquinone-9 beta-reductase